MARLPQNTRRLKLVDRLGAPRLQPKDDERIKAQIDEVINRHEAESIQTLAVFQARAITPKEPIIDGLISRRDLVALGARRRHGKTTLLIQLALDLAFSVAAFLGYVIPQARRTLLFLLEDDGKEIQDKITKQLAGRDPGTNIAIYTRDDFLELGIPIAVPGDSKAEDSDFQ